MTRSAYYYPGAGRDDWKLVTQDLGEAEVAFDAEIDHAREYGGGYSIFLIDVLAQSIIKQVQIDY